MEAIKPAPARPEQKKRICNICGKESASTICDACSARIRLEALAKKRREEEGNAWSHWE